MKGNDEKASNGAADATEEELVMPERVAKPNQAERDAKLDDIAAKIQAIKDKKDKARAKLDAPETPAGLSR